jgi:Thioredoxin-like domain
MVLVHNPTDVRDMNHALISHLSMVTPMSAEKLLALAQKALSAELVTFKFENENQMLHSKVFTHTRLLQSLRVVAGEFACILNGRLISMPREKIFTAADFTTLFLYEYSRKTGFIKSKVEKHTKNAKESEITQSDLVYLTSTLIGVNDKNNESPLGLEESTDRQPLHKMNKFLNSPIAIKVGTAETASVRFTAVANPATPDGQKLIAVNGK